MKYQFVYENKQTFSIRRMCQVLNIDYISYFQWQKRGKSDRAIENDMILSKIIEINKDTKMKIYGSPRICKELNESGIKCGHNRIARIMRENGIFAKIHRKHKYIKQKNEKDFIFENILDRNFTVEEPNKVLTTDITYIPTLEGWAYLCVFIDLFSRMVVGWAVSSKPNTELVLKALRRGISRRNFQKGMLVHSDRGCQYTSHLFTDTVAGLGYVQSMSRRGNCWDNACSESFFSHFKVEVIHEQTFVNDAEVEQTVFEYIEGFYNTTRRHSSCGNLSPREYEKKNVA